MNDNWKYYLSSTTTETYNFLIRCFNSSTVEDFGPLYTLKEVKIYQVREANSENVTDATSGNLVLYHGTSFQNATGILRKGFEISQQGHFGQGVYLTECSEMAIHYSRRQDNISADSNGKHYVFMNEVLNTKDLDTQISNAKPSKPPTSPVTHAFTKYKFQWSRLAYSNNKNPYETDSNGLKYRGCPVNIWNSADEYVTAAESLKPRYLFEFKSNKIEERYDRFFNFLGELFS